MLDENVKIVIPARLGSKGFPLKNRKLLFFTLDYIPKKYLDNTWITTNDDEIILRSRHLCNFIRRPNELSDDNTSIKNVMLHLVRSRPNDFREDDVIIMLYLTYPKRAWSLVEGAYSFFKEKNANSLLCKTEVNTHPFLVMYENGDTGKPIVEHDMYRRQDYPSVFEISHCVSIFKVSELTKLGLNLWNSDTVYYPIERQVDIDYEHQIKKHGDSQPIHLID